MNTETQINAAMINEALGLWNERSRFSIKDHPPEPQIYDFVTGIASDRERKDMLNHLSFCPECRKNMWKMEAGPMVDVACQRAAASREKTSFAVLTESGRCRILFRKLLNQKGKGVINLRAEPPHRKSLEGKKLVVTDRTGKELIRGEVVNGETPGRIVNADEIDWKTIIVREELS